MAHDILRFQIQMHDILTVHVRDTLANLTHEEDAVLLREGEIVRYDAFEKLTSGDAKQTNARVIFESGTKNWALCIVTTILTIPST